MSLDGSVVAGPGRVAEGSDTSSLVLCAIDRRPPRFAELGATTSLGGPKREVIASLVAVVRPGWVR